MSFERPDPDRILQMAKEEERLAHQGKLKIYLGAAPGVGKTYSMLEDALNKRAQGTDVVIGIVESHGRTEIEKFISQFEIIPRINVDYHGKVLHDFDLDAALKRNPSLILMDEMAHTNAPGLRHKKRWQDIKELLDRGIDVCTTLNVQHVESLNDIVSQIIHTHIDETVPDSMLELAHTIELIDLPPEDLIKRLQEGKVYFPEQIELAKESFFREGNLIALRELALRTTAQRVGAQVLLYRHGKGIQHIWPSNEKILVCVGPGPESDKLIRTARRIATDMQADWIALFVDVPQIHSSNERRNSAVAHLRLAEQLGGHTQIITGFNIVKEIMRYAREQNVTHIIIGKKVLPRWREWLFKNIADEIIRESHEIDIYVVTAPESDDYKVTKIKDTPQEETPWMTYTLAVAMTALATMINFLLFPYLGSNNLIIMFILSLSVVSYFGKLGPALLALLLSIISYNYFFIQPFFSFKITDLQHSFSLIIMILVGTIISQLIMLNRRQAETTEKIHRQISSLHILSRQLASTRGIDKLLEVGGQYIADQFSADIMVLLPQQGELTIRTRVRTTANLDHKEMGVAQWVYELGQIAGLGTDTLPFSDALYLPLIGAQGTLGVLRVHPINPRQLFTPQQTHLIETSANQIALAIEVDHTEEMSKETALQKESDKIRSMLLQSLSHDLRLPIISMMGSASTLLEMPNQLNHKEIKKLGKQIYNEADQLNRLLNNLLQISYLEEGSVKLQKEPNSIPEVISSAIAEASRKIANREVIVNVPHDIPLIPFDFTLIQEVLSNLIDNALKYTPPKSDIIITANVERDQFVVIGVEDRGPGIVRDEVNQLFEKFYRGRLLTTERGLGLGLAICRMIVAAHGGKIWAENNPEIGATFKFTLPLQS